MISFICLVSAISEISEKVIFKRNERKNLLDFNSFPTMMFSVTLFLEEIFPSSVFYILSVLTFNRHIYIYTYTHTYIDTHPSIYILFVSMQKKVVIINFIVNTVFIVSLFLCVVALISLCCFAFVNATSQKDF